MVGDPSDGIIAGYYAFGATNFDTATALTDMVKEATVTNNIRPGLNYYQTLGYLPDDGTYGCCNFYGSVSTLLEYTEADFAISQFATALGDTTDATAMLARAQSWQNVYDPSSTFFNPKLLDGTFVSGIGMASGQGMVEGSTSQYRWIVPFNRQAQLTAMGGPSVVNPLLQSFFTNLDDETTGDDALFSNEFELGAQYWNDYTGQPWAAQDVVNRLRTQLFSDAPLFMNNNDDLGAESSHARLVDAGALSGLPGERRPHSQLTRVPRGAHPLAERRADRDHRAGRIHRCALRSVAPGEWSSRHFALAPCLLRPDGGHARLHPRRAPRA